METLNQAWVAGWPLSLCILATCINAKQPNCEAGCNKINTLHHAGLTCVLRCMALEAAECCSTSLFAPALCCCLYFGESYKGSQINQVVWASSAEPVDGEQWQCEMWGADLEKCSIYSRGGGLNVVKRHILWAPQMTTHPEAKHKESAVELKEKQNSARLD